MDWRKSQRKYALLGWHIRPLIALWHVVRHRRRRKSCARVETWGRYALERMEQWTLIHWQCRRMVKLTRRKSPNAFARRRRQLQFICHTTNFFHRIHSSIIIFRIINKWQQLIKMYYEYRNKCRFGIRACAERCSSLIYAVFEFDIVHGEFGFLVWADTE